MTRSPSGASSHTLCDAIMVPTAENFDSSECFCWGGGKRFIGSSGKIVCLLKPKKIKKIIPLLGQDPVIRTIYDFISKHWEPKKKGGKSNSSLDLEKEENVEDNVENHEAECLQDDYGESCLAEALGVPAIAQCPIVEPMSDSQIPPDTFIGNDVAPELEPSAEVVEPEEIPSSQPVPEHLSLDLLQDTFIDPVTPASEVTATELEVTPQPSKVVEVTESPPPLKTVVTDPMPNAAKYSPEDLAALQQKIALIKQLPPNFM